VSKACAVATLDWVDEPWVSRRSAVKRTPTTKITTTPTANAGTAQAEGSFPLLGATFLECALLLLIRLASSLETDNGHYTKKAEKAQDPGAAHKKAPRTGAL
jgi:hypothetical protein